MLVYDKREADPTSSAELRETTSKRMAFNQDQIRTARQHLSARDDVMRDMIQAVGPFTLRCQRNRFGMLVRSIISQQISTGAARSIRARLEAHLAPAKVTAESVGSARIEELRSVGLSPQKATYLHDLSDKVQNGTVQLRTIGRRSDQDIVAELTQVKGIGTWTAQMFLIFSLGRLDVFPYDDLGVRMAIRNRYELDELPNKEICHEIAEPWKPYASVASWYCWRSLDLDRKS
jgi:DNA-3-methyladenine glycosylase II